MIEETKDIEIFETSDGQINIEVHFQKESVWLNQKQLSVLFNKDSDTIGLHLKNIFDSEELDESSTTEYFSVVQKEGKRSVKRKIRFYNLDAIISVGYRVNSKEGTKFRIWATGVLKTHLVQGFSVNEKRLAELQSTIKILKRTADVNYSISTEAQGLIAVLSDYSRALNILDDYDHQRLKNIGATSNGGLVLNYKSAIEAIQLLKIKFGGSNLFGNEKDQSFKSSIAAINQTFDGVELYPSIEEKAAHLLYFVVKNHSFSDGNKRIAAWLFVWYMNENEILYSKNGNKRIADNALVALTLMIAESKSEEKDLMIKVIINLISKENE
jgi:prophage maintenance system killer protein